MSICIWKDYGFQNLRWRAIKGPGNVVQSVWIFNQYWLNWSSREESSRLERYQTASITTCSFGIDVNLENSCACHHQHAAPYNFQAKLRFVFCALYLWPVWIFLDFLHSVSDGLHGGVPWLLIFSRYINGLDCVHKFCKTRSRKVINTG